MVKGHFRENGIFETEDYYMLRTPAQSLNYYKYLMEKKTSDFLRELIEDKEFRQAITIASPSFNNILNRYLEQVIENQNTKRIRNIISSLIKYSIRISSRPTPFGLFSGVSLGIFQGKDFNPIKINKNFRKAVRPDMEWLLGLVRKIEQSDYILNGLKVRKNISLHKVGDRLNVKVMSLFGQSKTNEEREVSVAYSRPLEKVLNLCEENILFQTLLEELLKEYKTEDRDKLRNYIKQLINQELLITELRPSLNDSFLMKDLSKALKRIYPFVKDQPHEKEMIDNVLKISHLIDDFNNCSESQWYEKYNKLIRTMKGMHESKAYLKLDSYAQIEVNQLPKIIQNEIADAAECLWKLNRHVKNSILDEYMEKFVETYGLFREVPVLDVISDELGIGFPHFENNKDQKEQLKNMMKNQDPTRQIQLNSLIQIAKQKGESEINLDDETLEKLTNIPYKGDVPEGVEIYAEIIKDDHAYSIILNPSAGAQGVGKSFGRFLYNDQSMKEKVLNSNRKVRKQNKEVEYIELVYLPSAGKMSNVMQTIIPTKYKLDISNINESNTHEISLDDLVLVSDGESLYIKSRTLNKEVRLITSHMFNYRNSPKLCRLLLEITNNRYASWNVFNWGLLQFNEYLPRVRRNNVILSPQTWKFFYNKLNNNHESINRDIDRAIEEWIKLWKIPRYVYLAFADLRLLIDLENYNHRNELINEVKKNYQFELQEFVGNFDDRFVESQRGKHTMEFVVPVLRKEMNEAPNKDVYNITDWASYDLNNLKRTLLPGDECLYVKLYGSYGEQHSFIADELLKFIDSLNATKMINKWFYIRYFDTAPHIRLRLFGNKENLNTFVLPRVNQFVKRNIGAGRLKSFSIHPYDREVERYGGELLIEKAEELFHLDSIVSAKLLNYVHHVKGDNPLKDEVVIGIISTVKMLYSFNLTDNEIVSMIFPKKANKGFMNEFRKRKEFFRKIIDPCHEWLALQKLEGGNELLTILSIREGLIQTISHDISTFQKEGLISHQQVNIFINSIIHMHCNRFLGSNMLEDRVRALIQLTMTSRQYMSRKLVT